MKKAQRTLEDVILDFILPCKESTLYLDIVVKTEIKRAERLATAIRSYYLSILPEKITIDNQDDYDDETNDEELYRFGWCAAIDEMKKRIEGWFCHSIISFAEWRAKVNERIRNDLP